MNKEKLRKKRTNKRLKRDSVIEKRIKCHGTKESCLSLDKDRHKEFQKRK